MVEATQQTQIKTLEDPFEKKMIEVFGPLLNPPTCQGTPRVKAQQTFETQASPRTGRQKGQKVDNTVQPLQRISITLANTSGFQAKWTHCQIPGQTSMSCPHQSPEDLE